jgi:hypothetical protein
MVTLIRTLRRIITPAPPPNIKSSETKTATTTTQTAQNISAGHVHHDDQINETETTANDAIEMNKKARASSAVTLRLTSTSSQKASVAADTSDVKSAVADPDERNTQTKFDRKRKASTDEDLAAKKADVNKYKKICSASGCTNVAVQGGVCSRHGAKVKRCSREGCPNVVVQGGVCTRHGAKVTRKLCSREECTNQAKKGGVCIKHGAQKKRCSSEGCTNYVVKGGVCWRHGAKVKVCSSTSSCPPGG